MKCFELLQKHFATCGIDVSQKSRETHSFNVKNLNIFILLWVNIGLNAGLLNKANTFDEITDILLRCVEDVTSGICYLLIVWKTVQLFEFINDLTDAVSASE